MVTTKTYDEIGSLDAKPGSLPWCIAVRVEIQHYLDQTESDAEHLDTYLRLMEKHEGWKQLSGTRGRSFVSFENFCVAKRPQGLGYQRDHIDRIVKERKTAQALAENEPPQPTNSESKLGNQNAKKDKNDSNNVTVVSRGNKADYLTRRIARDFPDILDRMKSGEFKSVRAAAKEAGIVKDPTALQILRRFWSKATEQERKLFLEEIR